MGRDALGLGMNRTGIGDQRLEKMENVHNTGIGTLRTMYFLLSFKGTAIFILKKMKKIQSIEVG